MSRARRGDLQFMLAKTVDIILSLLVIALILVILVALYNAFFGTDKQALNQYRLAGDMVQGVVLSDETGPVSRREFTFNFNVADEKDAFQGTIWAVNSDGSFASPLPPLTWSSQANREGLTADKLKTHIDQWRAEKKLNERGYQICAGKGCICLSKTPLDRLYIKGKVGEVIDWDVILQSINDISECKVLELPPDKSALHFDFDTAQPQGDLSKQTYPIIYLFKDADCRTVHGATTPNPDATVCIYGSMRQDALD